MMLFNQIIIDVPACYNQYRFEVSIIKSNGMKENVLDPPSDCS